MENMFCYQCQEAAGNKGCTKVGVCGKKPVVAKSLDSLKNLVKELSVAANNNEIDAVLLAQIDDFIMNSLFKCITNANFDDASLNETVNEGSAYCTKITG